MNAKSNLNVDIIIACKSWRVSNTYVALVIAQTIDQQNKFKNPQNKPVELAVILTNDTKISAVNKLTRGKNAPTNVLSFPLFPEKNQPVLGIGDVMVAYETVKAEALAEKKTFKAHFTHMIVHGTLHLLGYDHQTHSQARTMELLEVRILNALGIANPYPHRKIAKVRAEKVTARTKAKSKSKAKSART